MRTAYAFGLAAFLVYSLLWTAIPAHAQDSSEKTYKAKCAMCHGPDGSGATAAGKSTKARDLCSDDVKKETDAEWTDITAKGKNKMPAFEKKLTQDEVKDVTAYMRSLCKR